MLQASGSTVNPHTYVGRLRYYAMAGTGLYQLGHRELAAGVGRFLSADPARADHPYAYAAGSATVATDPAGLQPARQLVEEGGRAALRLLSSPEGEQARKWLTAAAVAVGLSVEEFVRQNWEKFCKVKHPSWAWCGDWRTKELAALDWRQTDVRKKPWTHWVPNAPYDSGTSKPNLPNRNNWHPLYVQRCTPMGKAPNRRTGTIDEYYTCQVRYARNWFAHPHGQFDGLGVPDEDWLNQSVVGCRCCTLFEESMHYHRMHHSGKQLPPWRWYYL